MTTKCIQHVVDGWEWCPATYLNGRRSPGGVMTWTCSTSNKTVTWRYWNTRAEEHVIETRIDKYGKKTESEFQSGLTSQILTAAKDWLESTI